MRVADLDIQTISGSLSGYEIDFVVSGSIAAVEAVKSIRALRRLGAKVYPWLTKGGAKFVTPTALEWASGGLAVSTDYDGCRSHVAAKDGLVIAPCSANFMSGLVSGLLHEPALALAAAYLGQGRPVMAVPCMHDSLFESPFVAQSFEKARDRIVFLGQNSGEGRKKFPRCPEVLADQVSHTLRNKQGAPHMLVTLGGTRSALDPVRYIGNYSSGTLGSLIAEELYRQGFFVHVVHGFAARFPRSFSSKTMCPTNPTVLEECGRVLTTYPGCGLVMAAALLDYGFDEMSPTKLKTSKHSQLDLKLRMQPKVLSELVALRQKESPWVAFKLETGLDQNQANGLAADYMERYHLSHFVVNDLTKISATEHEAFVFKRVPGRVESEVVKGKKPLADAVSLEIMRWYESGVRIEPGNSERDR